MALGISSYDLDPNVKVKGQIIHFLVNASPPKRVTFPPKYVDLYEQKPKAIKSFGIRILPPLEFTNIKPQHVEKHLTPNIPAGV